jgi:hypothetical protein
MDESYCYHSKEMCPPTRVERQNSEASFQGRSLSKWGPLVSGPTCTVLLGRPKSGLQKSGCDLFSIANGGCEILVPALPFPNFKRHQALHDMER